MLSNLEHHPCFSVFIIIERLLTYAIARTKMNDEAKLKANTSTNILYYDIDPFLTFIEQCRCCRHSTPMLFKCPNLQYVWCCYVINVYNAYMHTMMWCLKYVISLFVQYCDVFLHIFTKTHVAIWINPLSLAYSITKTLQKTILIIILSNKSL